MRWVHPVFCFICFAVMPLSARADRLTPEKLWDLARVGDAAVSPDGSSVAYLVKHYDLSENAGTSDLILQPLPSDLAEGDAKSAAFETPLAKSEAKVLLKDVKGIGALSWLVHQSGPKLVYIAPGKKPLDENDDGEESDADGDAEDDEEEAGEPQAWMLDPSGGEPTQLTEVEKGIGNLIASPSGDALAFTVDVKLDKDVREIFEDRMVPMTLQGIERGMKELGR